MASDSDQILGYQRKVVLLEAFRISYAIMITGIITTLMGFSLYWIDTGILGDAEPVIGVILFVAFPIALGLSLYIYDRRHERDLIIADAVLKVIHPIAALIRYLRGAGP
ncbi:uncharacterized protein Nmag_3791 (plasmid) [Natrialba magadii ATCC 43099]|uniref:Uncharacterized protein n=1 Tax=Natrialba magadii (strain ATCC 43099 / DSM 3394 / CCM 3739 / CIP 104546 / IAM 13178 / JCM 8861 / NBRC 102185 / NCIMB 2190 / MS3) TaxID=547559 RepID=D3T173_NATMM|nr:hypothetical protein [Natrialba magadii]ADD07332.1 uncharacterized protein Nmag_3791 [Natrialba magadii ATCC 43099]ELY32588.1 hypothetical protein C500_03654 [Natrialba magadii ATCC 43099]